MGLKRGLSVWLTAGCVSVAATAAAQQLAPAGMPALLVRSPNQTLDVTLSATSAYDDNLVAQINQTPASAVDQIAAQSDQPRGGAYEGLGAQVQYLRRFHHASFTLGERSTGRHYPSLSESTVLEHSAAGAFSVQMGQTSFAISQTAVTTPYYSYATLPTLNDVQPGDLPVKTADQSMLLNRTNAYVSNASVAQALGRRLTLVFNGTYQSTQFDRGGSSLTSEGASGNLSFKLGGGLALVTGYGMQQGDYKLSSGNSSVNLRTINLGLDFNKSLTMSRGTMVSVHTGTALFQDSNGAGSYQFVGDARLVHQIGRSWGSSAAFTRSIALVNGLQAPTLSNAVTAGLDGPLNRNVDLSFVGGYSRDQIGVQAAQNKSNTFSGAATVRVAVAPLVKLSATYVIYSYRFDRDQSLPQGIVPRFDRNELRLGLDVALPLVR